MSETISVDKAGQLFELTKILLAVIVGFFSSVFLKIYDSRKSIRNVKTILFKELLVNYDNVNKVLPKDNNFHPALFDLPVQVCRALQLAVYENYIGRLAELNRHELEKIFDAYHLLAEVRKEAEALDVSSKSQEKEPQEVFQLRTNIFLQNVSAAHKKIETALGLFKGGNRILKEAMQSRGGEYDKLFAIVSRAAGKSNHKVVP